MPVTRMLDYGMSYHDATTIHRESERGGSWDAVAVRLADAHLDRAVAATDRGHRETAVEAYRSAAVCLVFSQLAYNFDGDRKRELYCWLVDAFGRAAALDTRLAVQHLTVPFDGAALAGWLVRPPLTNSPPTVVLVGGQSGWGPAYFPAARALADRGIATLLAEIPGQGETRLLHGLHLKADVHRAFSALADHLLARGDLGAGLGVWGNSFGGLPAALAAARDRRFTACCVNGAWAHPGIPTFRTAAEQAAAMVGSPDPARIGEVFDALAFRPERDRLACPLLVLHGGADPLITRDDQQPFLDGADDATLRVWADGEHTLYNHAAERTAIVADWFCDILR
ncbi:alpha/beta hydrolase family protein [Streptomyces sp. NPDC058464]|uniref:alpha/beta hydrolase family protein n=1 Tax=Streptomyces sp. NPDC058464 TaxID=3346511 RepID=UPI00364C399B